MRTPPMYTGAAPRVHFVRHIRYSDYLLNKASGAPIAALAPTKVTTASAFSPDP